MKRFILALIVLAAFATPAIAQTDTVFIGYPTLKLQVGSPISLSYDKAGALPAPEYEELNATEQQENAVVIVYRNGRYLVATRKYTEVAYTRSGGFHIFASPQYVLKIEDPKMAENFNRKPRFFEVVHVGMGLVVYLGDWL